MAAKRWHPSVCRVCGVGRDEGVHISAAGNCPEHGELRYLLNHRQLKAHEGPFWDWWRLRSLAALGVLPPLLDTSPPDGDTPG